MNTSEGMEIQIHDMQVSGQLHAPAALLPVPLVYEVGWAPETVWTL
jgi:hypothetical protein